MSSNFKFKFDSNIKMIYKTPKGQLWCVLKNSKKVCVLRSTHKFYSFILEDYLKNYVLISYADSKQHNKKSKNQCLGTTNNNLQCMRLVESGINYCFQHRLPTKPKVKKEVKFDGSNINYIFKGMRIPTYVLRVIDPFSGKGNILTWLEKRKRVKNKTFTIESYNGNIQNPRNVFLNPPVYNGKFVITCLPYSSISQLVNPHIFKCYPRTNNLFRCFLKNLLIDVSLGGIIIVPLSFFSWRETEDDEDRNLRIKFFKYYDVYRVNIFEDIVIKGTSSQLCSFFFKKKRIRPIWENPLPPLICFCSSSAPDVEFRYDFHDCNHFGFDIFFWYRLEEEKCKI